MAKAAIAVVAVGSVCAMIGGVTGPTPSLPTPGETEAEAHTRTAARIQPRPPDVPTEASARPPADSPPSDTGAAGAVLSRSLRAASPVALRIPSIDVETELMELGLQADGTLEVPSSGFPAGWYTGAPTPGELGPAVIAGHVDWGGRPGVFFELRELLPGDDIAVDRQDGSTAHFRVTRTERFDKDAFPTRAVYGDLDHAGLRLITCGGSFDREARSYRDNLVVFAELR